jgi:hypothetical protein
MSGFGYEKRSAVKVRGEQRLLSIEGAERAVAIAKECGLKVEILAYAGEKRVYTAWGEHGAEGERTDTVPEGNVWVEVIPGVGIPNYPKFWKDLGFIKQKTA